MWNSAVFNRLLRGAALPLCAVLIGGCGGGYAEVVVEDDPPPVALLAIALTRVGPEAIEIDWSDDPYATRFLLRRDGLVLADLATTSVIDASVLVDERYCYQVSGYDAAGVLVAASDTACVTLLP